MSGQADKHGDFAIARRVPAFPERAEDVMSRPNPYELAGRSRKVDALIDAIDWVAGRKATAEVVLSMSREELNYAVDMAAVNTPSDATIQALAERIMERDVN